MKYKLKTLFLLVLLSGLFLIVGGSFGGQQGLWMALIFSLVMNVGAYWFSDKVVLAMHGAKPLPQEYEGLYAVMDELSQKAGVPVPKLFWIPDAPPNAFATGRDPKHGTVVVTQGLLNVLSLREVRGVLAHELGHILNRDTLISAVVAVLASALMHFVHFFAFFGGASRDGDHRGGNPVLMLVTVLLAPLAATLIQLGVSRSREYLADETAAKLTEDPEALASALQKISGEIQAEVEPGIHEPQPGMAHLYIMSPIVGGGWTSLFMTHPPVKERVRRLREMLPRVSNFRFDYGMAS